MIEVDLHRKQGSLDLTPKISDSGLISISGKNGSGKTSTLLMISGFLRHDRGYVKVNSRDVSFLSPQKRSIVYINQDTYFPNLDVDEHLTWGKKLSKFDITLERVEKAKSLFDINYDGKVRNLSVGQRVRVSLATVMINGAEVLAVDEAFSNLHDKETLLSALRDYAGSTGTDILFVTQDKADLEISDHSYEMDTGQTRKIF